jgi:hypothetical protein
VTDADLLDKPFSQVRPTEADVRQRLREEGYGQVNGRAVSKIISPTGEIFVPPPREEARPQAAKAGDVVAGPVPPKASARSDPAFRLTRWCDITVTESPAYLIKGLIPSEGLIVIWGPPKCGKSFFGLDISAHIARGQDYRTRERTHRVQQGPVVYLALEGGKGFERRVEAYKRRHAIKDMPFYLVTKKTNLISQHPLLIDCIKDQCESPVLVVIDTLNRSIMGSENNDKDMGDYIRAADVIREAFGCAVAIIHHCGTAGDRPRGHTSLTGAVDAQLAMRRDDEGTIIVQLEYLKDGEEGLQIYGRLEVIEIGTDEDGDPMTSCVLVPAEAPAVQEGKRGKLSKRAEEAWRWLANCLIQKGQPPPTTWDLPNPTDVSSVVRVDEWRAHMVQGGVLKKDDHRDATKRFSEARGILKRNGIIEEREGWVWLKTWPS